MNYMLLEFIKILTPASETADMLMAITETK